MPIETISAPIAETPDEDYVTRRKRIEKRELDDWVQSQIQVEEKPEPAKPKEEGPLPFDRKMVVNESVVEAERIGIDPSSSEFMNLLKRNVARAKGVKEEEAGAVPVDINILKPSMEDVLGVLLNPAAFPAYFAGGAWQAYRAGLPMLRTGMDWALMGLPSLGKGIVGFGKGISAGFRAPRLERPLKKGAETIADVIAKTTPESRVAAKALEKMGVQVPARGAAAAAENIAGPLDSKIQETSKKILKMQKEWDGIVEKARRGVISHEEAREAGRKLGLSLDDIKNMHPGTAVTAEKASAIIDTIKPIADDAINAAKRYKKSGKPEDLHEALYKFYAYMEADPKRLGALAETGRSLSQLNPPMSGINDYLNQFATVFSELGPEGITPNRLVDMLAQFESPEQLAIMAGHVTKAGGVKAWADAILEGWIMGLLTGVKTHAVNFTSNTLTAIMGPTERALASRLAFGKGKHVVKGEATEMVYGMIEGFMDGLSVMRKSWRTGVSQFGGEKVEYIGKKAISSEALNLSGTFGRAVDRMGNVIRGPGRALVAADDVFKSTNFRANMRAMALREGTAQGFERHTQQMAGFIDDFLRAPPQKAVALSRDYANYMTFTKELDGLALTAQKAIESHPYMRVILPFWRTPVNIFKFSLERTPLMNALSGQLRKQIMAGGVERDMAMGKVALSSMIAMAVYTAARAGYITGSGPKDKNLRRMQMEAGWMPDSLRLGDNFYSFTRMDPASVFVGAVADLAEVSDQLTQPQIEQYVMGLVLGFMEHSTTKTYLTGITDVLEAIKEPDLKATAWAKRWTRSVVPTLGRHIAQEMDPVWREAKGVLENIRNGVPGWREGLFPSRNLKGEVRVQEGAVGPDIFSTWYKSTLSPDPVWRELFNNKIGIPPVPWHIGGPNPPVSVMGEETEAHGVELTPEEHDWVARMAGNELKVGGKGMWDTLTHLIQTPEYKKASKGPRGTKADLIKTVVNSYRELAFAKLRDINDPLEYLLRKKMMERIGVKLPKGEIE